jgi:XTP/dITP diphosphohydrolase
VIKNGRTVLQIVIATQNKGKIKEIKDFFTSSSFKVNIEFLTFEDFSNFPDVEEGSKSFFENAGLKAKNIAKFTKIITLADDSGLIVDKLNGAPGVESSRYSGPDSTDKSNRIKLLAELKDINVLDERTARFVCVMVLWDPKKGLLNKSIGICDGHISFEEMGENGFGYDSIFIPDGYKKTMAQLSNKEKNIISHRAKALLTMSDYLKKMAKKKTTKKICPNCKSKLRPIKWISDDYYCDKCRIIYYRDLEGNIQARKHPPAAGG